MEFLRSKIMAVAFIVFGLFFIALGVGAAVGWFDYSPLTLLMPGMVCIASGVLMMRPSGGSEE